MSANPCRRKKGQAGETTWRASSKTPEPSGLSSVDSSSHAFLQIIISIQQALSEERKTGGGLDPGESCHSPMLFSSLLFRAISIWGTMAGTEPGSATPWTDHETFVRQQAWALSEFSQGRRPGVTPAEGVNLLEADQPCA